MLAVALFPQKNPPYTDLFLLEWNFLFYALDFKYNVSSPVWSDDSKSIYFASLAEGIQGIFEAYEETESWEIRRITGEDLWYDFGSPFHIAKAENGDLTLYATWCSMDFPTELVAVTVADDPKAKATGKKARS